LSSKKIDSLAPCSDRPAFTFD